MEYEQWIKQYKGLRTLIAIHKACKFSCCKMAFLQPSLEGQKANTQLTKLLGLAWRWPMGQTLRSPFTTSFPKPVHRFYESNEDARRHETLFHE